MLDPREIRRTCARIAARATSVRVVEEAVVEYVITLDDPLRYPAPVVPLPEASEARAALALTIAAVNFGSGWFPTLRKRDGRSGFFTIALGLADHGPWEPEPLARISAAEVADTTGQDAGHELMALYAQHLRELGRRAVEAGGFLPIATRPSLAGHLATWPTFADAPFYKRAQITAYDMACAGLIPPGTEGDLTMFADNLVPHVLRMDGVLEYDAALLTRIDAGRLLEHGSCEEVEIRACGLHAVELIVAARPQLTAPAVDHLLWTRGQEPRYKARPRHRARCTAY